MAFVIKAEKNWKNKDNRIHEILVLDHQKTSNSRLSVSEIHLPKKGTFIIENPTDQISCFQVLSGSGYFEKQFFSEKHIGFVPQNTGTIFQAEQETTCLKTVVKGFKRFEKAFKVMFSDFHPKIRSEN